MTTRHPARGSFMDRAPQPRTRRPFPFQRPPSLMLKHDQSSRGFIHAGPSMLRLRAMRGLGHFWELRSAGKSYTDASPTTVASAPRHGLDAHAGRRAGRSISTSRRKR